MTSWNLECRPGRGASGAWRRREFLKPRCAAISTYSCSWKGSCISQNSAETNLSFANRSVKSYSVTCGGLTLVILCCIWFKQRDFRKGLDRSLRTILRDLSLIMQFLRALAAVALGVMASLSLQGCGSEEESVVVTGDSSTNTTMTATMTMTTTVTTVAWAWQTVWAGSRFRRGPGQVEKQGMPACQVPKCRVCMMLWNLTTFHLSFAISIHLRDWALASLLGMLPCHKCTCTTNPWPSGHAHHDPFCFQHRWCRCIMDWAWAEHLAKAPKSVYVWMLHPEEHDCIVCPSFSPCQFGWPFDFATIGQSLVSQRSADHRFHFKDLNMRRVSLWEGASSLNDGFVSLRTGKKSKVLMGLSKSEENIMEALEDSNSNLAAADVILCLHVWVFHIKHLWMCYNTSSACGPPNRLHDMSSMCWPWQHGQAIADDKGPTARDLSIWGMGVKIFRCLRLVVTSEASRICHANPPIGP